MPYKKVTADDLFVCQMCGECCKGFGGTFVTESDINAIAAFIQVPSETFVEKYCRMSGKKPVLAQGEDQFCIFWDEVRMCTIHPVKPRMCRAWPFIPAILKDPRNWEIMSGACPGIRTDFPPSVVERCVREKLRTDGWYPAFSTPSATRKKAENSL
ncbi:MAG: zinc/iron-chelating domain-containing protein [Desulfobacterales bacterium CG23_combo_of_CG06-09_8_20_14_all_51_8]|nr:MAG: zinc/iron-chelating domain-containing protein [Desulfobacterales bacterium CG23_combo_of_CG06-09_8_20_14_all_51_8]